MRSNRQIFDPHRLSPEVIGRYRYTSVSLCRLCGSIGFIVGSLTVFYGIAGWMEIDNRFVLADVEWTTEHVVVVTCAVVAGIILGLIGFGLGASIRIVSPGADHRYSVLWHYVANGTIIWMMLLSFALNEALSKVEVKHLFTELGTQTSLIVVFGPVTMGTLTIAAILLMTGQLRVGRKPDLLRCCLFSMPVSLCMSFVQYDLFNLQAMHWMLVGVVFPIALIPVSTYMIARDVRQKRELVAGMDVDA